MKYSDAEHKMTILDFNVMNLLNYNLTIKKNKAISIYDQDCKGLQNTFRYTLTGIT